MQPTNDFTQSYRQISDEAMMRIQTLTQVSNSELIKSFKQILIPAVSQMMSKE